MTWTSYWPAARRCCVGAVTAAPRLAGKGPQSQWTAVGVLVLALLLGGAVENGCASLLGFFGAGAWAAALEPYTLFGQFSALAQGGVPEAGALLFAGFVAVASAAAAVVVFRRREPGRRHGPLPECRRHRRHVLGNPELLSPLCDPAIAILSAVPRPLKMAKLSPLLSSSSIVIPSYTQRWYNWV